MSICYTYVEVLGKLTPQKIIPLTKEEKSQLQVALLEVGKDGGERLEEVRFFASYLSAEDETEWLLGFLERFSKTQNGENIVFAFSEVHENFRLVSYLCNGIFRKVSAQDSDLLELVKPDINALCGFSFANPQLQNLLQEYALFYHPIDEDRFAITASTGFLKNGDKLSISCVFFKMHGQRFLTCSGSKDGIEFKLTNADEDLFFQFVDWVYATGQIVGWEDIPKGYMPE